MKPMSRLARKSLLVRRMARTMIVVLIWQVIAPVTTKALTTGPGQPESMSFTPASSNGLVDLFSGNFQYNIPVLDLPGPNGSYPFTLGYQSGIGMDDEASWVGLGWNLSPGAINRSMRGLPDEFNGDVVEVEQDMKSDVTVGVSFGPNLELLGGDLGLVVDLSLYYNSYRGFGYSLSPTFSIGSGKTGLNLGLGLSLDSQEGVGMSPSLSLSHQASTEQHKFEGGLTFGAGYNSREGLTSLQLSGTSSAVNRFDKMRSVYSSGGMGMFSKSTYMPTVQIPMKSWSINGRIKTGVSFFTAHANTDFGLFYSQQELSPKHQSIAAYGYQHLEKADEESMMDFNRTQDGTLRKEMPNLGTPSLTNDVYSISGNGVGGSFRAWRNDIGIINDRKMVSESGAGGFGLDNSLAHLGFNANLNAGAQKTGKWKNKNEVETANNSYGFHDKNGYAVDYEPWYFKVIGDEVSDPISDLNYLYSDQPVRIQIEDGMDDERRIWKANPILESGNGTTLGPTEDPYMSDPNRRSRNTVIQPHTIAEMGNSNEVLPEFRLEHYVHSSGDFSPNASQLQSFDRNRPDHHLAGMSVVPTNGMHYVYGLPAYNESQTENLFSAPESGACDVRAPVADQDSDGIPDYDFSQSDKFLSRKSIPEYAHSYLLSSVLGTDYVDADGIAGPSNDDLGFWVKFNYVRTDQDMKWRAPFVGANLDKGNESEFEDDRANYMYGEKENWYLATAETKTHIAEFHISPRKDGRGAAGEIQNAAATAGAVGSTLGGYAYKLDSISLYVKKDRYPSGNSLNSNAKPLSVTHFEYSYELCPQVWNNENYDPAASWSPQESGKLTLKQVWTTHQESTRGALNPIAFHYDGMNPAYDPLAQDRWGNFQPFANACEQLAFPYVNHSPSRATLDSYASAWSMTGIDLPTGGKLEISYEADDYGYVQNKQAMRMLKIKDFYPADGQTIFSKAIYDPLNPVHRRVYFETDAPVTSLADVKAYAEGVDQVYMKVRMKVRKATNNAIEYVPVYAEVEDYGFDNNGAFLVLKRPTFNGGEWENYHPVALAGWNHLRVNMPRLVSSAPPINMQPGTQASAIKQKAKSLLSVAPEILKIFKGYYKFAEKKEFSSEFDPSKSWVRLNDPDHTKVGGGCRVKSIVMHDDWGSNPNIDSYSNDVGIVYDYSTEYKGQTISSGVASYEPMIGGDENPFKRAKFYPGTTPMRSDLNLFFEHPVNESYMPGASVGYRKVTVKSMATQEVLDGNLAATVPTTGAAVHEFWTAKDFPTLVKETPIEGKPFDLYLPVPFVGGLDIHDFTASQGYSVVLNDMHGKPRKSSNFGMTATGSLDSEAISWVEYDYADHVAYAGRENEFRTVRNRFPVLLGDVDPNDFRQSEYGERIIGQDHEFIVDMRETSTRNSGVGVAVNVDIVLFGIPLPGVWPNLSYARSRARTAVTNKIIYRSGRVTGMTAFSEGSLIETRHLAYDEQTGRPLLSEVTNNYGDPVFKYEYPAFWAYDQMGPAFKNMGLDFTADLSAAGVGYFAASNYNLNGKETELLIPGDEFIVTNGNQRSKAWFVEFDASNQPLFHSTGNISGSNVSLQNVRSGRRNLLGASALELTALKDPTRDRDTMNCWKNLAAPNDVLDSSWVVRDTVYDTIVAPCVENWLGIVQTYIDQGGGIMNWGNSNAANAQLLENYCLSCIPGIQMFGANTLVFECVDNCQYQLADAAGNLVPWLSINAVANPEYVFSAPFTLPTVNTFTQVTFQYNLGAGPQTGYLMYLGTNGNCGLPLKVNTEIVTNYHSQMVVEPNHLIRVNEMFMVDSVLTASAQTFSDAWMQSWNEIRFSQGDVGQQLIDLQGRDPWANGQRGNWKPQGSYVYVADRGQSEDLNPREDGTFSGVPIFDFQSSLHEGCDLNWRKVKEVTRYTPYGYEAENRDILDVYSAALYGYQGKLPIAIGANADYNELGFESFEEYPVNGNLNSLEQSTGNLHFYTNTSATPPEILDYADLTYVDGVNGYMNGSVPSGTQFSGIRPVEGRTIGSYFEPSSNVYDRTTALATGFGLILADEPYKHLNPDSMWSGRLGVYVPAQSPLPLNGVADYVDTKAHTGNRSLRWAGNMEWLQHHLRVDQQEKYALQAWVSRDDINVPFYQMSAVDPKDRIGIKVNFFDQFMNPIGSSDLFEPSGHLIEGWQKVEGEFEVPAIAVYLAVELQSGNTKSGTVAAYLDDIRVQPLKSRMSCHVYDPLDFRLQASLDDDNFALRYLYDEAGNVYLVQKETIDGWRTITESRGYFKKGL